MSSEPQDLNEFDATDCGLAALMLGVVPAIIHFVFCGGMDSLVVTGIMAAAGVFLGVAVWAVAYYTHTRVVGILVNLAGCILTPLYIAVTVYLWVYGDDTPAEQEAVPVQQAEPPAGE